MGTFLKRSFASKVWASWTRSTRPSRDFGLYTRNLLNASGSFKSIASSRVPKKASRQRLLLTLMSASRRVPIATLGKGTVTGKSNSNKANCVPLLNAFPFG